MMRDTMATYAVDQTQTMDRAERLDVLGQSLNSKLLKNIQLRDAIEQRWLKDLRQYHGRYEPEVEQRLQKAIEQGQAASNIYVNITRSKCEIIEGRLFDMLFPTDGRNWDLTSLPAQNREMRAMGIDPAQAMDIAKEKCRLMRDEIDEQLSEARYTAQARDVIKDAVKLGTGIIKGPIVTNKARKSWEKLQDNVYELNVIREYTPGIERVDPWDFIPDMAARKIEEAEFTFERRRCNRKTLRKLARHPGYMAGQIRKVLSETTDRGYRSDTDPRMQERRDISRAYSDAPSLQYEIWEYHGQIDKEDLEAAGIKTDDDPLIEYEGVVQFIDNTVIRVDLHPLESEDCIYSVLTYVQDDDCIFGYGAPYVLRASQTAMCTAWRMMLDNSALSVGPQTVINANIVKPADNSWSLAPKKVWLLQDKSGASNVGSAFGTFDVRSYQPEMLSIINQSREFADAELNVPKVASGEGDPNATTAYGTSMLMNSAGTGVRRMVKNFDDSITIPLITRFYDWNMQYGEREDIKGDYEVTALGTSTLLVKETQTQQLLQFATLYANPAFAQILAPKAAQYLRRVVEAMHIPADDLVPTDEELQAIAQQQAQQQGMGAQMQEAEVQQKEADRNLKYRMHQEDIQHEQAKLISQRDLEHDKMLTELAKAKLDNDHEANMSYSQQANQQVLDRQPITQSQVTNEYPNQY